MSIGRLNCTALNYGWWGLVAFALFAGIVTRTAAEDVPTDQLFQLHLRQQVPLPEVGDGWMARFTTETWDPVHTAVIVCDMWDAHHCYNAVQRVKDMAPRMNALLNKARSAGALIIHAPSSCMEAYVSHPARRRATLAPTAANLPEGIGQWCENIPTEQRGVYPIDQSDGGEDDDPATHQQWHATLAKMGRNPQAPWIRQIDTLEIEDRDAVTDSGHEVWNLLEDRQIDNVIMVGVHTNMCVLGRPFGLRQLVKNGKHVVLVRDLTDAMYNPAQWPYVNHHSGTDLIIEHIEKYVCPTIESTDIQGGEPHRFFDDKRPRLVVVVSEFEYETFRTLPDFARRQLLADFKIDYVVNSDLDQHSLNGIETLGSADVAVMSIWRRALPAEQLAVIRRFVDAGRPIVAIRTTSHAFMTRDGIAPAGHALWPDFDESALGGRYEGHYGNHADHGDRPTLIRVAPDALSNSLLNGIAQQEFAAASWLYKMRNLGEAAVPIWLGRVGERSYEEPIAWTYLRPSTGGRSFYTSLGHPEDFELPEFQLLLRNAVYWAVDQPVPGRLARSK